MDYKIAVITFVIILAVVFFLYRQSGLQSELTKFGASIDANGFSIVNMSSSQNVTTILAQRSNEFIRIEVFSSDDKIINETFSSIGDMFKPVYMTASYGVPTQTVIIPPQEIFPQKGNLTINSRNQKYYLLYADVNLAYDITSLKDSQYRVLVTFSQCGSRLFKLEFFEPKDSFSQEKTFSLAESFKC
jgi:hypothetical protein